MNDFKVFSSSRQVSKGLGQMAKALSAKIGLRGAQVALFNLGKAAHPAENNRVLLKEYSEYCEKQQALGRAIPSYMAWLADRGYVKTVAEGGGVIRSLPESEEEGFEDEDQEAPEGAEDTEEEL